MVIGEAAKASGVSAKMVRYYESIGLVPTAVRTEGGYRTYGRTEVETLRFIRRARDLGLSMERIKLLVGLWHDRGRPSREVKRIALEHVAELRTKIGELTSMCATLEELAVTCHGDNRPDCPILVDLAAGGGRALPGGRRCDRLENRGIRHRPRPSCRIMNHPERRCTMRTGLALAALLLAAPVAAQGLGGYAGQQTREIKALSPQEQSDLLVGRGMGLARAGELNHHPGPAHVLELRDKLDLTPDQVATVQASFHRMEAAAKPLGAELVVRERDLDTQFQQGTMTPSRLAAQTEAIGSLQGRLRAVHLAAHLEMQTALTPAQIAAYDTLRGYAGGDTPAPAHSHRMQPG